jgi:hypothetical protein
MVLKGFKLSEDDELPDEQDPGQSAYPDNKCPDIAMLERMSRHCHAENVEYAEYEEYVFLRSLDPWAYFCPGKNMQNMQNILFNMHILFILHMC